LERGTGRGGDDDVLQAEVIEVADEGASRSRVGERVTPEHPLEADPVFRISACDLPVYSDHESTYTPHTMKDWNSSARDDFLLAKPPYRRPIPGMMSQTRQVQKAI